MGEADPNPEVLKGAAAIGGMEEEEPGEKQRGLIGSDSVGRVTRLWLNTCLTHTLTAGLI